MSKGSSVPATQTTKTEPYLKADVSNAAKLARELQTKGVSEFFPGKTVVDYSPETEQSLEMIKQQALSGSSLNPVASASLNKTISGDYLQDNPFLEELIGAAQGDVSRNFLEKTLPALSSGFAGTGRYGSGIQQQVTSKAYGEAAKSAGDIASNLRYQNYNDERARQMQAAALAPTLDAGRFADAQMLGQVGASKEALQQARLQEEMDRYYYNNNTEATALDQYISRIAQLSGGYGSSTGTSTQAKSSNPLLGGLSGGLTGLGIANAIAPAVTWGASSPLMGMIGGPVGIGLGILGALAGATS